MGKKKLSNDNKAKRQELGYAHEVAPFLGRAWIPKMSITVVNSIEMLKSILSQCTQQDIALDTETTGLNVDTNKLVGISLSWEEDIGYYLPVGHLLPLSGEANLPVEELAVVLTDFLASKRLICFNRNFDVRVCENNGIKVRHLPYIDVQVMAYLYDNGVYMPSLKDTSVYVLGREMIELAELFEIKVDPNKKKRKINYALIAQLPIHKVGTYAACDAINTFVLYKKLLPFLKKWRMDYVWGIDNTFVESLNKLSSTPVYIDQNILRSMLSTIDREIHTLQMETKQILGSDTINLNSRQQVAAAFLRIGVPLTVETDTSTETKQSFSVAEKAISNLKKDWPVVQKYLEHSSAVKFRSFIEGLMNSEKSNTYWGYLFYSGCSTPTGRLSASNGENYTKFALPVNIQNQPKPEEVLWGVLKPEDAGFLREDPEFAEKLYDFYGWTFCFKSPGCSKCKHYTTCPRQWIECPNPYDLYNLRRVFIPPAPEGWIVASVDYSQQELVIPALISKERTWLDALKNKQDLHTATAARFYKIPYEAVTKKQRKRMKTVNFGGQYGMGPESLAEQFGISLEEAEQFQGTYYEALPNLQAFLLGIEDHAMQHGWIATYFRRVRFLNKLIWNKKFSLVSFGKRSARSTRIQGTGGDIIRISINRYYDKCDEDQEFAENVILWATVHDELDFYIKESYLLKGLDKIIDCMVFEVPGWELTLPYSVSLGKSWGTCIPFMKTDEGSWVPKTIPVDFEEDHPPSSASPNNPSTDTLEGKIIVENVDFNLMRAYQHLWSRFIDTSSPLLVELQSTDKKRIQIHVREHQKEAFLEAMKTMKVAS